MNEMESMNIYDVLRLEEYKQFVEKKGKFDYLSWAVAWDKVKRNFPYARYKAREYDVIIGGNTLTLPYMVLPNQTAMVKVDVWITDANNDEHVGTMELAIRDNRNQAVVDPDSAQVENSIRRCLAKAVSAVTGFGIELWFGEDIKGLDYTKETHFTGHELKIGNATGKQTRKLDELRRNTDCPSADKKRIQEIKDDGWDISENHAQIVINDVSEAVRLNKKPTKTKINSVQKLVDTVDVSDDKRNELNKFMASEMTTHELETLETKLNNKLESK